MTEWEQIRAKIKQRLLSYKDLHAEHQELRKELQRLEELIVSPAGPNLDGMPRSAGPGNPTERAAFKCLAVADRYEEKLADLAAEQERIEAMIEGLEPIERRLARLHYIDGLKLEDVCEQIHYSLSQTHRIKNRALDKLTAAEIERRKAQK